MHTGGEGQGHGGRRPHRRPGHAAREPPQRPARARRGSVSLERRLCWAAARLSWQWSVWPIGSLGGGAGRRENPTGTRGGSPHAVCPRGLTLAGAVQVLLPEHQAAALHGARVELQAEDDVTGGRAVLLVVALHLGRERSCSHSTARTVAEEGWAGSRARWAGAQVMRAGPGNPGAQCPSSALRGPPGHADAPEGRLRGDRCRVEPMAFLNINKRWRGGFSVVGPLRVPTKEAGGH